MPTPVYPLIPEKQTFFASDGTLASGYQLFVYTAGTSTKATSYTETDGATPNANPLVLDARGEITSGLYVVGGATYKLVFASDTDTDPPASPLWTRDNLTPFGSPATDPSEWIDPAITPTFVSSTQFTYGTSTDETAEHHVGRRLRATISSGTIVYATITAASYSSPTTTLTVGEAVLDSGLSKIEYSILSADGSAVPHLASDADGLTLASASDLTLATHPQTALDAVSLRMLGPNYIRGLRMSNGTDTANDIDIAAGACADSSNVYGMVLTGAGLTKQIDAAFAAGTGAGGMFTGSVAINTWYHVFVIRKDDDGTFDAGFDTSITAANIPAGYTAYRRIGSVVTDGSSQIRQFHQDDHMFWWNTPLLDMDQPVTTAAEDDPLTEANAGVPPGINAWVWANFHTSAAVRVSISSPVSTFVTPAAPSATAAPLSSIGPTADMSSLLGPFLTDNAQSLTFYASGATNVLASVICYRDPLISTGVA